MTARQRDWLKNNWFQVIAIAIMIFGWGVSWSNMSSSQASMVKKEEYNVTREKVDRIEKNMDLLVTKLDSLITVILTESEK